MKRIPLLTMVALAAAVSTASAQTNAKLEITIKVPAKTPSFENQRLVVNLFHDHPQQTDRGNTPVDRFVDAKFSHEMGEETTVTITLGEKAKVKDSVRYYVEVIIFDKASNRTHIAEVDGRKGPTQVVTGRYPRKLTAQIKPVAAANSR